MSFEIRCQSGIYAVNDLNELDRLIQELIDTTGDATYWLCNGTEIITGFLFNGEQSTVYRYADLASPINTDVDSDEVVKFTLENGELSEFHLCQCIKYDDAMAAFIHIAKTGELPTNIEWDT